MKVKSWPITLKALAIISLVLTFSLVSCTKSTEEGSDELSLFDSRGVQILSDSLIDMPKELLMGGEEGDDPDKKSMTNIDIASNINVFGDNDNVDIPALNFHELDLSISSAEEQPRNYGALYDVARNYVSVAAGAKDQIGMFINTFLRKLEKLQDVELPLVLPHYLLEGSGLYQVIISPSDRECYIWKVSLFYSEVSQDPETVFYLSATEKGGKGRMFMTMANVEDEYAAAVGIPNLALTKKVEATFSTMQNPQTFEFKYIGDRTEARNYAERHWADFPHNATGDAIKDALTKFPEKIFLTVKYYTDKEEWDVYGASYHPGWALLEKLDGKAFWNDTSRTIYSFKAKSLKSEKGAKLALALPKDTSDSPNETDSVGSVFTSVVMGQVNYNLTRLSDDVNDFPPDFNTCGDDCVDPPGTPPLYAGDYPAEQYKATVMYDCIMSDCFVNDINDRLPPNPMIVRDNLETFVESPPTSTDLFPKVLPLYNQCKVINYMVNPVFFRDGKGLVGTYNDKTKQFYEYTYGTSSFKDGAKSLPLANGLVDISLANIGSYTPAYIKHADIHQ